MFGSGGFVHLNVRSYFSIKDGAFSPEDLALRAAELGMPAIALTDRDGLYGAARFAEACRQVSERVAPVRPIYGATLTIRTTCGDRDAILLAKDAVGYASLCRSITTAHMTGERGDPALTTTQVCERSEGLICLLGPSSEPGALAAAGRLDSAREALRPWREAFGGEDLFVEVQHRLEQSSLGEIRRLLRLADDTGLRAVATNGVRYLMSQDAFLADILECMREIVPIASHHVTRRNAEGWLKPAVPMRELFAQRPDVCDQTLEIADRCRFDIGLREVHFPRFPTPPGRSAGSVLAERCWRGLEDRRMTLNRDVRDRLDHELAQIQVMGYAAYFLTVAEICDDIRSMGIRVACRGSAAGSLVCYLTRISEVDPVRHGLLFERFINPLREELPDIDIDVESARRKDVYDMILARHGDDRCACVTMIDTFRARGAIREVGKALGYPEGEVDLAAKAFPHIGAHHVREAMSKLPELKGINLDAGQLDLLFRVVERLNGFPRHLALHPSGVVLSGHDLPDRVPLERSFEEYRMVQADKDDVELLGLLKLDVLGVRMLSAIRHCLDEIARTEDEKVDLNEISCDDQPTFELIRSSDTLGCFQIESPGQRELLQKFQPTRWDDLVIDISLFRPGPVKSDMITPFLNRLHKREAAGYAHPRLRPVLEETFGVVVYHEELMRVISVMTGHDLPTADRIRRHLDDGAEVEGHHQDFVRRAVASGVDPGTAESVWKEVVAFASFGFCKAHAAAFAVPTYQSAWLKAHYPAHFLAGVLTHEPGMYPRRLILDDARRHGIEILPLDVNSSEEDYTVEVESDTERPRKFGIRIGFKDVHGISDAEIRSILQARAGRAFADVGDFIRRTAASRPVTEALAHAGAFDQLPGGTRRDHLFLAMVTEAPHEGEQAALQLRAPPSSALLREYSDAERVRAELEVVGMDASRHLMSFYQPLLDDLGVVAGRDLWRLRGDRWVMVAGVKVASQTPAVRSGQRIIFLTLDDGSGLADITVFERVQPWCAKTIFHGLVLAVWGRLRRTGIRGASIVAERVWDLTALAQARREDRLTDALAEGGPSEEAEAVTATGSGAFVPPPHGIAARPIPKVWHASGGSAGR